MAQLTEDQKKTVAQWVADGASLNDVQDKLKREFDITLTYLDARLLVMELGLKLQEKKQPEVKAPEPEPAPADAALDDAPLDGGEDPLADEVLPPETPLGGGSVTLSLDTLAVPGTMVSGKVTFSDGKTAGWYVDQFGRLGLRPPEPGYQPPPADIPAFQRDLDRLLQQQGY